MAVRMNVNGSGKIDLKVELASGSVDVKTEAEMTAQPSVATAPSSGNANIYISSDNDSQELDQGYKYIVEVILNLNHDRFKSYFNYFIVSHLGIVTAMHSDFSKTMADAVRNLSIIGIVLGVCWLAVLYKIQKDIKQAWSLIRKYEESTQYTQKIKISETGWKCYHASWLMLLIPLAFLAFYVLSLIK